MKFVIQRVNSASVKVDGNVIGSIGKGYLIQFGAGEGDTEDMLVPFAELTLCITNFIIFLHFNSI